MARPLISCATGGAARGAAVGAGAVSAVPPKATAASAATACEAGAGSVSVIVNFGMSFKGEVEEADGGGVTALVNGFFEGNIVERLGGNVSTSGPGVFKGNSEHQLPGTCTNTIVRFEGAACNLI